MIPRGPVASGSGRCAGSYSGDDLRSESVGSDRSGSDDKTKTEMGAGEEAETEVDSHVGDPDWGPATGTPPSDFSG